MARTGTLERGESRTKPRKNSPSRAMANGMRELASTLACSAPNEEIMSATAVIETAIGPRNRFSTSVATDELKGTLAICKRRQRVEIGGIDEQVQGRHHQRAADEGARQIALRISDLARERRDVLPAVVGPQGAEHRGSEAGDSAARAARHAFAGAGQARTARGAPNRRRRR